MPIQTAERFRPFGTTIFAEMSRLAAEHNAVNLSQGFPDFDGPDFVKDAAKRAIDEHQNQYARSAGVPELVTTIAGTGVNVLLVEQNAETALSVADYAYILEGGSIVAEDKASVLAASPAVQRAYLGI